MGITIVAGCRNPSFSQGNVVAVMPYFGLACQDRKDKPRVAIGVPN